MINSVRMSRGSDFTHFSLLRKAVMNKSSGVMLFRTLNGSKGKLLFHRGEIHVDDNHENLVLFLSNPMGMTNWQNGRIETTTSPITEAVAYAINNLAWTKESMRSLGVMYCRLPNIQIDTSNARFENFLVNISQDLLLQKSSASEGIKPTEFLLQDDPSSSLVPYRLKVFTFNYVLGLMHTAVKTQKRKKIALPSGILKRIMNKIYGIK